MLTSDAIWVAHINAVTNKASRILGLLRQTLKIDTKSEKEQAYNSFFRPDLEHAWSLWYPHNVKHIKSLEAIQQRGLLIGPCTSTAELQV